MKEVSRRNVQDARGRAAGSTVIECFGAFRVNEAYSAEETPAHPAQGQGDDDERARGAREGREVLDEGLQVRRTCDEHIAQNVESE